MRLKVLFFLLLTTNIYASSPEVKTYSTFGELETGTRKGVSITEDGTITLAPAITLLHDTGEPLVWCITEWNGTVFAGTGNSGKLIAVDKNGNARVLYEADDPEIYTVKSTTAGQLYFGTSPSGHVYTMKENGTARLLADLDVQYIWDILVDDDGALFVATGDPGNIYRIDTSGAITTLLRTDEAHIRTLAFNKKNDILAGTSKNGYLYRVQRDGRAFVLYDCSLEEINNIVVGNDGTIFLSALQERAARLPEQEPEQDEIQTAQNEEIVLAPQIITISGRSQAFESAVYKIDEELIPSLIWHSRSDWAQSIAVQKNGELLIGTGKECTLFSLSEINEVTTLAELDATQITTVTVSNDGSIYAGTSNMGKLFKIGPQYARKGVYESPVLDADVTAQWGQISWKVTGDKKTKVLLYTRSGNTEKPNATWNDWSDSYNISDGEAIKSEAARFIQWKAELQGSSSEKGGGFRDISIAYIQRNVLPLISKIYIYPPGDYYESAPNRTGSRSDVAGQDTPPSGIQRPQSMGNAEYRQGYRTISWIFEDRNNDFVTFDVFFKNIERSNWYILSQDLESSYYSWNTQMMPDGKYLMRVKISDSPSNPDKFKKSSEKISEEFLIDNTSPNITNLVFTKRDQLVHFVAQDEWSRLSKIEYSLDAREWIEIYPIDEILDSKLEDCRIKLYDLGVGEHELIIRAVDEIGNIGFGTLLIRNGK